MFQSEANSIIESFFLGNIRNEMIFPFSSISDEELLNLTILLDNLDSFVEENIDNTRIDHEGSISKDIYQGLADIGVFAVPLPDEHEGYGFSTFSYLKVIEVLAAHSPAVAASVGSMYSLSIKAIELFGTDEQKKKYLPSFAAGDTLAAFALSEDNAGSDINGINTRSLLSDDGDYYIVNGTKKFVANASMADIFICLAKTEVDIRGRLRERISAYIIPKNLEGISITKRWQKLGMNGLEVCEVAFDNVHVPRQNIIGQPGQGYAIALALFNEGRLAQSAGCIGLMKQIYKLALAESKKRKQFSKSIVDFEIIQDKLLEMTVRIFVAESMVYLTAGLAERGKVSITSETAACKIFCTESLWIVVNAALQIAGGQGYMTDLPYEQALRDARMHLIVNGTNEILRTFIAQIGIKNPSSYLKSLGEAVSNPVMNPTAAIKGIYSFASQKLSRILPFELLPIQSARLLAKFTQTIESFKVDPILSEDAKRFEKEIRLFADTVETLLVKHNNNLLEQEFQIQRLANIALYLFASTSLLSRMQSLISIKGENEAANEFEIARIFFSYSLNRIKSLHKAIESNRDSQKKKVFNSLKQSDIYNLGLAKFNFIN